jgi:hypothetical protein
MKAQLPNRTRTLAASGLLLLACFTASAHLPGPHEHEGIVKSINFEKHSLTLAESEHGIHLGHATKPSFFVWDDHTQFLQNGEAVTPAALSLGTRLHLYYHYQSRGLPPLLVKARWKKN